MIIQFLKLGRPRQSAWRARHQLNFNGQGAGPMGLASLSLSLTQGDKQVHLAAVAPDDGEKWSGVLTKRRRSLRQVSDRPGFAPTSTSRTALECS